MRPKPFYTPKSKIRQLHIDWPLFLGILSLCLLGLCILYSAQHNMDTLQRQIMRLILAFGCMFGIAQIPPRFVKKSAPWLYGSSLLLLSTVLFIGHISKGGQRWLDLGFFHFQPAELMKLGVPMMIAYYFSDRSLPPKLSHLIVPGLLILIPVFLIAKQPDLGTALVILSSGIWVIFFTGLPWSRLLILLGMGIAGLPALWWSMRDYQKERLLAFWNPEHDPLGSGYQIIQSKIAIGSGGLYGKGWLNGTQSQLEFLPERTTDLIFAVWSEEFGLVGCLLMIALYLCIILRGLYISTQAQDTFGRLLAGSLVMTLFVYVLVNMGMVSGLLPAVGVPLPLVSYGGSSIVTLMLGFGLLMSMHTHRSLLTR